MKVIALGILLIVLFNISIIKAKDNINPYIDSKNNLISEYNPKDFYDEWIVTGWIQYACASTEKELNNKTSEEPFIYHELGSFYGNVFKNANKTTIILSNKTSYFNYYQDNYHVENKYKYSKNYTYFSKNYLDKAGKCGGNNILVVEYGVNNKSVLKDKFIVINNNKLLYKFYDGQTFYLIVERKKLVPPTREFIHKILGTDVKFKANANIVSLFEE